MEDDYVVDMRIAEVVEDAVDEHPLADLQGGLHRPGGNLIRLDHEGLDQERQADRQGDDDNQLDERTPRRCGPRDQFFCSSESSAGASGPPSS